MLYPTEIRDAKLEHILGIMNVEVDRYKEEAIICAHCSFDSEVQTLLDETNLDRFVAVSRAIQLSLKGIDFDVAMLFGLEDKIDEVGRLIQAWITLGSVIETSLQIFLAVYLYDYERSGWHKWIAFDEETVKEKLVKQVDELEVQGQLDKKQAGTLKDLFKKELKARRNIPKVEKIMLTDLIAFYKKQEILDGDFIKQLEFIRDKRNCIHSFQKRSIGYWHELLESLKFYCYLLITLRSMMPDCSDLLSIEAAHNSEMASYYGDYY